MLGQPPAQSQHPAVLGGGHVVAAAHVCSARLAAGRLATLQAEEHAVAVKHLQGGAHSDKELLLVSQIFASSL